MKNQTPQRQFKRGYVPQEPVQPNSMENREAASPRASRKRDGLGLGTQIAARPGLAGVQARSKISKASKYKSLKATG